LHFWKNPSSRISSGHAHFNISSVFAFSPNFAEERENKRSVCFHLAPDMIMCPSTNALLKKISLFISACLLLMLVGIKQERASAKYRYKSDKKWLVDKPGFRI